MKENSLSFFQLLSLFDNKIFQRENIGTISATEKLRRDTKQNSKNETASYHRRKKINQHQRRHRLHFFRIAQKRVLWLLATNEIFLFYGFSSGSKKVRLLFCRNHFQEHTREKTMARLTANKDPALDLEELALVYLKASFFQMLMSMSLS